jgi:hypothetical protein
MRCCAISRQRRVEIEERAAELVGAGAVAELSRERMQGIALATRTAKTHCVDGTAWREQARARAAEHGLGATELSALHTRDPIATPTADLAALTGRLSGSDGLTGQHNTFARRHALAEIAGAFPQGTSVAELEAVTTRYLNDESVAPLTPRPDSEPRYTTVGLLAREREIIDGAQRQSTEHTGALAPSWSTASWQPDRPGSTTIRRRRCGRSPRAAEGSRPSQRSPGRAKPR